MGTWTQDFWERLDWRKPNRQLALETGKSAGWVAHRRWQLRKPKATLKFPIGSNESTGEAGDLSGNGVTKAVRKRWRLRSPDGRVIEGANLRELVRTHASLFPEGSTTWTSNRNGQVNCIAERGLYHSATRGVTWRGWTATRLNSQEKAQIERVLQLATAVAERRGLDLEELRSRCRTDAVVQARAEAMQEAHLQGFEHVIIGRALNRTQGAVSYAINKIEVRRDGGDNAMPASWDGNHARQG